MLVRKLFNLGFFVALTACSGATSSGDSAGSRASGGEASAHAEHHPRLTPAQHHLHELLAPVWHSEPGPARDARACEQAAAMRERANGVQSEALPPDAPANAAQTRAALVQAAQALVDECSGSRANVNARLSELHTAFHNVFERR